MCAAMPMFRVHSIGVLRRGEFAGDNFAFSATIWRVADMRGTAGYHRRWAKARLACFLTTVPVLL